MKLSKLLFNKQQHNFNDYYIVRINSIIWRVHEIIYGQTPNNKISWETVKKESQWLRQQECQFKIWPFSHWRSVWHDISIGFVYPGTTITCKDVLYFLTLLTPSTLTKKVKTKQDFVFYFEDVIWDVIWGYSFAHFWVPPSFPS